MLRTQVLARVERARGRKPGAERPGEGPEACECPEGGECPGQGPDACEGPEEGAARRGSLPRGAALALRP